MEDAVDMPPLDLDRPGTFLYRGADSTAGYELNRFALSLRNAQSREKFIKDEAGYVASFGLSPAQARMVETRDWTALLEAGCHLHAMLKLAATVGQTLFHIGAHNAGVDVDWMRSRCPRRVSGLGGLGG